jgi:hypothetical protein
LVRKKRVDVDRREALKKLAAGSAVAAGASIVLTSNGVAFAASIGDTGLDGGSIPGPGEPVDVIIDESVTGGNDKEFSITNVGTPACTNSGQPTTTYQWQIVSFTNGRNKATSLVLRLAGGQTISSTGGATGFTSPSVNASSGVFGRADGDPMKKDSYVAEMRVTWTCSGSSARVEALYRFTVVETASSQETLEWNIIAN